MAASGRAAAALLLLGGQLASAVEPYNCGSASANPYLLAREWSSDKLRWCCLEKGVGCQVASAPTPAPVGPDLYDCHFHAGNELEHWTLRQKAWCCAERNLGCHRKAPALTGGAAKPPPAQPQAPPLTGAAAKPPPAQPQAGNPPAAAARTGCAASCTAQGVTATCSDRIQWHSQSGGEAPTKGLGSHCLEAHKAVLEQCQGACDACTPEQAGCPVPSPAVDQAPAAKDVDEAQRPGAEEQHFDCTAGFSNWERGWSEQKKVWCCLEKQRGCPPTQTTTSTLPFDCDAGFANWRMGWSPGKKMWCCDHASKGCPTTSTTVTVTTVTTTTVSTTTVTSTTKTTTEEPYDCLSGRYGWETGWTIDKKVWCCDNYNFACMAANPAPTTTENPLLSTKTTTTTLTTTSLTTTTATTTSVTTTTATTTTVTTETTTVTTETTTTVTTETTMVTTEATTMEASTTAEEVETTATKATTTEAEEATTTTTTEAATTTTTTEAEEEATTTTTITEAQEATTTTMTTTEAAEPSSASSTAALSVEKAKSQVDAVLSAIDKNGDGHLNFDEINDLQDQASSPDIDRDTYNGLCEQFGDDPEVGLGVNALMQIYANSGAMSDSGSGDAAADTTSSAGGGGAAAADAERKFLSARGIASAVAAAGRPQPPHSAALACAAAAAAALTVAGALSLRRSRAGATATTSYEPVADGASQVPLTAAAALPQAFE